MINKTTKPQKPHQEKITLKFMDVSVTMTGNKNIEKKALNLLSCMVKDRMRVFEVLSEHNHEDEDSDIKSKSKKIKTDTREWLSSYV